MRALGLSLAGAAMLTAATLAVGRPSVFTDTDDYYAQGRSIVHAVQAWAERGKPIVNLDDVRYRMAHPDANDQEPVHNQDGARSAYYGLALYALQAVGTLWLVAFAQSWIAAAVLYGLWRAAAPAAPSWTYGAIMGALSGLSSLPIFTGFAMPDVFAGFAAIAAILLTVFPDRFSRLGLAGLWLLLAAAMNFHTTNLLTALAVAVAGAAALAALKTPWRALAPRLLSVAAAAALAMGAADAYGALVKLRSGDDLGRPPFLTARVLADGPGRSFLAKSCRTGSPWAVCAFKWLPLDDSEDILWSDDTSRGIFNMSDFGLRQKLEEEDVRFALASTLNDPAGQAKASLDNWRRQIFNTRLDEPLMNLGYYVRDSYWKTTNLPKLIKGVAPGCGRAPGDCLVWFDPEALAVIDGALAFVCAAGLILRLRALGFAKAVRVRGPADPMVRVGLAGLLMLLAVIVNAAVCGALSGPFPRYQARIVWLFTCAFLVFETAHRRGFAAASAAKPLDVAAKTV